MQLLCHASHHGKHTKQGFCVISCLGAIKVKDVKDMDNQTVMIRAALVSHVMRIPKFSPWILHVLASSRVFAMVSARSPNVQVKAWSFETKTTSEMIHFSLIVLLQSLDHIGSSFFHVFTCHICSLRVFHVATKFQSCFNHFNHFNPRGRSQTDIDRNCVRQIAGLVGAEGLGQRQVGVWRC